MTLSRLSFFVIGLSISFFVIRMKYTWIMLAYAVDKENAELEDTLWSDDTDESFFDDIRSSSGYRYAKNKQIVSVDIRIDQT